jgi:hypothetical protein
MNIRERYNLEESEYGLVIYPHKPAVKLARWFVMGMIPGAVVLFFLKELVGEVIWYSLYVIMGYCVLLGLYEILVRAKVHYRFSVRDNAVYKSTVFYKDRKILQLDEVVVFTSSETGTWRYKMGARKSQFVKNYTISEDFGGRKKHEAYEQEVLERIYSVMNR